MKEISRILTLAAAMILALSSLGMAEYGEAPMLTELVDEGELPPVEDRLPDEPLVIEPYHSIGEYGGTWYSHTTDDEWNHTLMKMYGHSPVRWVDDGLDIAPNWVQDWESNEDATVWTLHVREGIRWSDGEPFTGHDFMFWWEDFALDEEHSDPIPDMLVARDEPAEITLLDDYTIQIEYAGPAPLLPERMAMWVNTGPGERYIAPKHYLSQYHPEYTDEYDDYETLEERMEWWLFPGAPTITEWVPVEHELAERLVLERNPYFYAVDTEGNQLPYIDRKVVTFAEDIEVLKLRLMDGESDFNLRPYLALTDMAMMVDNQEAGGYEIKHWDSGSGTGPMYYPNWNHPDEEKREVYRTPEFLRALSVAMDRERMQSMLYFGEGRKTTGTFSPKAVEYTRHPDGEEIYEQWEQSYVEHDPEQAAEWLDEIGVVDQTGDGWRDLPSGESLTLRIDYDAEADPVYIQTNEMVQSDWQDIGLRTELNPMDGAQLGLMTETAEFDIHDSWEVGDGPNHWVFPQWMVPIDLSRWAPLYGSWYQQVQAGTAHEEADEDPRDRTPPRKEPDPEGPIAQLHEIYDEGRVEADEAVRDDLVMDMVNIHMEYGPFFIGTVSDIPRILIHSEDMRNVPESDELGQGGFVNPWIVPYPAITRPAQFWLDQ